jgi:hypothetical protein
VYNTGGGRCGRTYARGGCHFGWRRKLPWREGVIPPLLLVTLQFFFCQHSKLKQMLYRMIFLIINYVLDLTPQAPIKPNNLVFLILNYTTMKHTLLQLLVVLLDRHVTLIKVL